MGERHPGHVPDPDAPDHPADAPPPEIPSDGFDTDGDGTADTMVTDDGVDLILLTDLDGDGLADQVLRIGPDGVVREAVPEQPQAAPPGGGVVDGLFGGATFEP
jgi:hypothetical protein